MILSIQSIHVQQEHTKLFEWHQYDSSELEQHIDDPKQEKKINTRAEVQKRVQLPQSKKNLTGGFDQEDKGEARRSQKWLEGSFKRKSLGSGSQKEVKEGERTGVHV